jgi:hypothetical protein
VTVKSYKTFNQNPFIVTLSAPCQNKKKNLPFSNTDDQAKIWIDYATASLKVANLWDSSIDGPNDSDKTKLVLQLNLSKTNYKR